jgi:hypothetical protein
VLHQQLQHRLGDGAEKVAVILLLQRLDQRHGGLGRRGLHRPVVEVRKLDKTDALDGHPGSHRRRGAKFHHVLGR